MAKFVEEASQQCQQQQQEVQEVQYEDVEAVVTVEPPRQGKDVEEETRQDDDFGLAKKNSREEPAEDMTTSYYNMYQKEDEVPKNDGRTF